MKILTKGSYYGTKKVETDVNGLVLSEYAYEIPRTDWHYHENPYFMYVLQGQLYDVNKGGRSRCPSGSLLFHNWQEQHFNEKASHQARGFHLEFERSWFEAKKLNLDLWQGSQMIQHPKLHQLFAKIYYEFKCADDFTDLGIELSLLEVCEAMQKRQDQSFDKIPPWVEPLKEMLHQSREKITLQLLSEELGVHPVHLSRAIPKYLSVNLAEYLRQIRIQRSIPYLLDDHLSLTEIAFASGFSDQSHFIRTFKTYFQMTPRRFRRQIR